MMRKTIFSFLAVIMMASVASAQGTRSWLEDTFFQSGKYYVAVAVLSIIFIGIVIFLIRLDLKLSRVEKEMKNLD